MLSLKPWKWSRNVRLYVMLCLCTIFFFIELIAGYAVGSIALVADAFHMLSDVLSLIVALYAIRLAAMNRSDHPHLTFGYQRAEILGALVNGVFLLALCFTIIIESIQRFIERPEVDQPWYVLYVGSAGLVVNLLGLVLFHEHSHSHSHGHSHSHSHSNGANNKKENTLQFVANQDNQEIETSPVEPFDSVADLPEIAINDRLKEYRKQMQQKQDYEVEIDIEADGSPQSGTELVNKIGAEQKKQKSDHRGHDHGHSAGGHLNMHGVFLHVLGDALASIAVIISALAIIYSPEGSPLKTIVDPLLSIVITLIILYTTIPLIKNAGYILLQGLPTQLRGKVPEIRDALRQIDGVVDVHELHVWQLSDTKWVSTVHVNVDTSVSETGFMQLAVQIKDLLHSYGIHIATVQPEFMIPGRQGIIGGQQKQRLQSGTSSSSNGYASNTEENPTETSCLLKCTSSDCLPQSECCPPKAI
ncbi:hypothetical protein MP228_005077 [Amoeboaphelidium protococcarum]|nr:hypothetical protein MP228_005077 [Amoeboaphelidium protococcarum]